LGGKSERPVASVNSSFPDAVERSADLPLTDVLNDRRTVLAVMMIGTATITSVLSGNQTGKDISTSSDIELKAWRGVREEKRTVSISGPEYLN